MKIPNGLLMFLEFFSYSKWDLMVCSSRGNHKSDSDKQKLKKKTKKIKIQFFNVLVNTESLSNDPSEPVELVTITSSNTLRCCNHLTSLSPIKTSIFSHLDTILNSFSLSV